MADKKQDDNVGIEATIMALRELLMEYFKGTCVERCVEVGNIRMINASPSSTPENFQYLRRENERQQPMTVLLNKLPIMSVQKAPDHLTLNVRVLSRSPQLRKVLAGMIDFMEKYLIRVEVEHNERGVLYANNG